MTDSNGLFPVGSEVIVPEFGNATGKVVGDGENVGTIKVEFANGQIVDVSALDLKKPGEDPAPVKVHVKGDSEAEDASTDEVPTFAEAIQKPLAGPDGEPAVLECDGVSIDVCSFDKESEAIRQAVVNLIRGIKPGTYKEYRELKYPTGDSSATFASRHEAYGHVFEKFAEVINGGDFDALDADTYLAYHCQSESIFTHIKRTVMVLDPKAFAKWRKAKTVVNCRALFVAYLTATYRVTLG